MKRTIAVFAVLAALSSGCATSLDACGQTFRPYGPADEEAQRVAGVRYSFSIGNAILSVFFIETIFVPIILEGWYMMEPDSADCAKVAASQ